MFDHILAKFKGTTALTFKVIGDSPTTQPKPTIDGIQAVIPYNVEVTLPQPYYDVVVGAGYDVELIGSAESDPAPGAEAAAEPEETTETKAEDDAGRPSDAAAAPDETLGGGSDAGAGGSEQGAGAPATELSPAFDADAVIDGNVNRVTSRLGALTDEQLALVQKAEADREVPRSGVTKAIEAELAKRTAAPGDGA